MKKGIYTFAFLILMLSNVFAQLKTTNSTGNWTNVSIWTPSGVPAVTNSVTVNHNINFDRTTALTIRTAYLFNANVTQTTKAAIIVDAGGVLTITKTTIFKGIVTVRNGGRIIIKNGGQLNCDSNLVVNQGSTVTLEDGALLNVKNNYTNNGQLNNAGVVTILNQYLGDNGVAVKVNNGTMTSVSVMRSQFQSIYGKLYPYCPSNCNADNFVCSGSVAQPVVPNYSRCGTGNVVVIPTGGTGSYRFYTDDTIKLPLNFVPATRYTFANISNTVSYYVTSINNQGCESARVKTTLTINALPDIIVATDTSRCRTGSVQLKATGADSTYKWYNSTGTLVYTGLIYNTPSISASTFYRVGGVNKNKCVTPTAQRDVATVTINTSCTITWTGKNSNSWNLATNWDAGQIPTSTDNVIIPSGTVNQLLISGIQNVGSFTVAAGATVAANTLGVLNVFGDLNVLGNFNNSGKIEFKGNSPQQLAGNFPLPVLAINSNSSVVMNNPMTVTQLLLLTQGQLISNGNLSIDLNTGNIDGGGVGSIVGNIRVFKSVGTIKTHYFSCPLNGVTCQDLVDDAVVVNADATRTRLAKYDHTLNKWSLIYDMNTPLEIGVAYSMYFTAPTTLDFTGTYDHSYVHAYSLDNSVVKSYFVPNPYPCSLDWDASSGWVNKSAVLNNAIYFWDAATGKYVTYSAGVGINGATNIIPSMQGYWVETNGAGGTMPVVIGKGACISSATKSLWKTANLADEYTLTVQNTSTNVFDETIVRFMDGATVLYDNEYDAKKYLNPSPNPSIYSKLNTQNLAIQSLPNFSNDTIIPLGLSVPVTGNYKLSLNYNGLNTTNQLYLYDSLTKTSLPVNQSVELALNSTQSLQRFALVLSVDQNNVTTSIKNNNNASNWFTYESNGDVYLANKINSTQVINYTLISSDGWVLNKANNIHLNSVYQISELKNAKPGVYILSIDSNQTNQTVKIVIP